ncbi:hypothetical protein GQR58_026650 [Nymphon striatum]|nr:hypothetical protein GQR58_026650 [Nymphon striatum]
MFGIKAYVATELVSSSYIVMPDTVIPVGGDYLMYTFISWNSGNTSTLADLSGRPILPFKLTEDQRETLEWRLFTRLMISIPSPWLGSALLKNSSNSTTHNVDVDDEDYDEVGDVDDDEIDNVDDEEDDNVDVDDEDYDEVDDNDDDDIDDNDDNNDDDDDDNDDNNDDDDDDNDDNDDNNDDDDNE